MGMNRLLLVILVTLSLWTSQASGRILTVGPAMNTHQDDQWIFPGSRDGDLGEHRVAEILEAVAKLKTHVPKRDHAAKYKHLDEIDRLKLSINKIICDSMEEGCDQMDDM